MLHIVADECLEDAGLFIASRCNNINYTNKIVKTKITLFSRVAFGAEKLSHFCSNGANILCIPHSIYIINRLFKKTTARLSIDSVKGRI